MSILYCPDCGHKNEYSIHPPNFCGDCGASLGKKPKKGKARGKKPESLAHDMFAKEDSLKDDETDIDYVPDIGKLDVEISYEGAARVFKGSDLLPKRGAEEVFGGRESTSGDKKKDTDESA